MIDLHCHILPGIDDGARDWEDSLILGRLAVEEGITHLLATPHHLNGKYQNTKQQVITLTDELQGRLKDNKIPLQVFPSQEVRISGEIMEGIEQDEILFADESNRYLLLELPTHSIPHYADQLFFQLQQKAITPIIVHPERNKVIQEDPDRLLEYVEKGVLAQLTAASYAGKFGKDTEELSKKLIEANLVHVLASDAHNTRGRQFYMREAFEKLEKEFGKEKAACFQLNAKKVINGDYVNAEEPKELKKKWSLFSFFK